MSTFDLDTDGNETDNTDRSQLSTKTNDCTNGEENRGDTKDKEFTTPGTLVLLSSAKGHQVSGGGATSIDAEDNTPINLNETIHDEGAVLSNPPNPSIGRTKNNKKKNRITIANLSDLRLDLQVIITQDDNSNNDLILNLPSVLSKNKKRRKQQIRKIRHLDQC